MTEDDDHLDLRHRSDMERKASRETIAPSIEDEDDE